MTVVFVHQSGKNTGIQSKENLSFLAIVGIDLENAFFVDWSATIEYVAPSIEGGQNMLRLKYNFLVLAVFMTAGFCLTGNALANPVCGTLEECRSLRTYLQEQLVNQDSEAVRTYLQSQLTQVDARIEELLTCQPGGEKRRTTTTGAVFTRDRSHAALNEAWRDPDGLIWGDIVKNKDGSVRSMVQSSEFMKERGKPLPGGTLGAKEYCKSIGARLPSREEFIRLREYMGARSGTDEEGYSPQVLPNLSGYEFWSSSVDPSNSSYVRCFDGSGGDSYYVYHGSLDAVRCVVGR